MLSNWFNKGKPKPPPIRINDYVAIKEALQTMEMETSFIKAELDHYVDQHIPTDPEEAFSLGVTVGALMANQAVMKEVIPLSQDYVMLLEWAHEVTGTDIGDGS